MKNNTINRLAMVLVFISVTIIAEAQTFQWAVQFGEKGDAFARAITVDLQGNVYTTGYFGDTVDFDPDPAVSYLLAPSSAGASAIFVSKVDNLGKFVWAKKLGGKGSDLGHAIAVDDNGYVYTTGQFSNSADFDPGSGSYVLSTPPGEVAAFVSKLDVNGGFVWAKKLGGGSVTQGISIALDNSDNVYTTGRFSAIADFDPDTLVSYTLSSFGGNDVFISKLNSSGDFVWAKQMGGTGEDQGLSIFVSASDEIFSTGFFNNSADFDPSSNSSVLTSSGGYDVFISKLSASGNFVWAKQIGGTGAEQGRSIKVDTYGDVYLTGYFSGKCDFDPGAAIANLSSVGSSDIFVAKLDSLGGYSWAQKMGGLNADEGYAVDLDAAGNVYTAGFFSGGSVDFNPDPNSSHLFSSVGGSDVFISKLNASGNFVWAQQIGGDRTDNCRALTLDGNDNIYTTGYFDYKCDFDPDGNTVYALIPYGRTDAFVHKISQGIASGFDQYNSNLSPFNLFPNPTAGVITISANREIKNVGVKVFNSVGKLILEKNVENFLQYSIDITEHTPGIYIVEIQRPSVVERIKFVKAEKY